MSVLNSRIHGLEYFRNKEENFFNIKIPISIENQLIIESFLNEFQELNLKKIIDDWFIDEKNCSIISPNKTQFLTKRELIFIQLLLKNKIVTYEKMLYTIWEDNLNITDNAIKSFVKNFKKKMPPSLLENINGIGYRLSHNALSS
ncbi:helix-turn-helix domain-containing protein [Poseidonibacter ostreae]|uniref:OmpR/PhoB-type domain-containing protein n=1 Tax=Poseidonibacter ostreae TaxID=2654171 RepID=A0A6L4WPS1_9BACT|nr:helix-turn-helix domain-containing protein [Poseidonibacter ostreae]KAB7884657.1 hypothetical protein GA417_10940 [Poseidonibacter ostreae]KAB7885949.1 hypothetical protein GBG19_13220 [Poseidonibacter ostreae]KAB7888602.1 hypothetical protein GBG18_12660 [Poseidonibacter ostreae]